MGLIKLILTIIFFFLAASIGETRDCDESLICNNYVVCDEKQATMTRAQFNEWIKTPASKNGYTIEWSSSSRAWVIYQENCKMKKLCWDEQGECS